jgi:hypothetical protein
MKPDAGQLNHIASGAIYSKTKEVELTSRKLIKEPFWQDNFFFLVLLLTFCLQNTGEKKTGIAHGYFTYVLS